MGRKVEVKEYKAQWKRDFQSEKELLQELLGYQLRTVHHIGSTSIPGMHAKPVIDILIEVLDIDAMRACKEKMEAAGYKSHGENGIAGRRFYSKGGNERTHHVHIFGVGDPEIARHLAFRDYLINHPDEARKYAELKMNLARRYSADMESYISGKDAFIKDIDKKASTWKREREL
ncbi:GrpB family protein [Sediminibacillus massiliensis]|uniref:GrpB family protein n=1 Tax=Sediminibacillus massiliensis TaxID=1926277 RepID=UPI0009887D49|nr:GrpB family protein [Sediminibacillus massiliensis]